MSFLDRLNDRIAARVHGSRPRIVVEKERLILLSRRGKQPLPLGKLTEATLLHRDVYAGDAIVLRLGFRNGHVVEVFQDDPCWFDLMAALDRSGAIPVPSVDWQLAFLGSADGGPALDLMTLPNL